MDLQTIALSGREIVLRPLILEDADALAEAAGESRDNYGFTHVPEGVDGTRAYIENALHQRAAGERYPFAIFWRQRIVGSTSYMDYAQWKWPAGCKLQRHGTPDAVEIGYTWLAHSAQRTRCNTEAKFLLLQHAFETWKVHSVCFWTDERNLRSRAAIQRLGAKFEGIRRAHKPAADCMVRNSAVFSIVASEWSMVKDRLAAFLQ